MTTEAQKPVDPFIISRDFAVPVAALYRMWSDREAMKTGCGGSLDGLESVLQEA
jgi:uncharacterized protein YndB with AHSA1/START domain